jgi:metal-responsive CopG/Arc/MetJ family transcriptional regulator
MASMSTKVAVSIHEDLYRAVEKARKRIGKSRSAILQDAIRQWLKQQEEAALVRAYEAGYRAKPENRREVEAAQAAAVRLLAATQW